MTIWHIIENDSVIDSLVADSKEIIESIYPDSTIVEDDGTIGVGWVKENDIWKAQYPTDGLEYNWNEEEKRWDLVFSPEEESVVE
jgi:hypothetical protein